MESELKLKQFLASPIIQENVLDKMGEAVDLIEKDGPFEMDKLKVLMHAINDGKLIPGQIKEFTAKRIIDSTGNFWKGEPEDGGSIDRWLKCAIDHDYLEIFTLFGTNGWVRKYIRYGLKHGTTRWLQYFFHCDNFGKVMVEIIYYEPELAIKLIDSWKMVLIPDILKKNESAGTSLYQHLLNNPLFHQYLIENFPQYSQITSKKDIIFDITKTFGIDYLEKLILDKASEKKTIQKCQDQIDF